MTSVHTMEYEGYCISDSLVLKDEYVVYCLLYSYYYYSIILKQSLAIFHDAPPADEAWVVSMNV